MVATHLRRSVDTNDPPSIDTTSTPGKPTNPYHLTSRPQVRRDEIATALFSTWVVVGLFLDGWAHNAEKPETFWTPWHGVLYSGFVAGGIWAGLSELRERRARQQAGEPYLPPDRFVLAGFGCFAFAGVADTVWHSVFGIEADVEALLSPAHLLLMGGGLLLVTSPVRAARQRDGQAPTLRTFAPAAVGITLAVAVVAFFLQFASALHIVDHDAYSGIARGQLGDLAEIHGVVGVLLPNALLLGAVLWTLLRWQFPPMGTFTLLFGATALLMAGLEGFEQVVLVLPVAAGGAAADLLVAQGARLLTVLAVTPLVLWLGWFAVYHAAWGLGWAVELWTGSVAFAVLTGVGLGLIPEHTPSGFRGQGQS